jgi:hypothetical protein
MLRAKTKEREQKTKNKMPACFWSACWSELHDFYSREICIHYYFTLMGGHYSDAGTVQ